MYSYCAAELNRRLAALTPFLTLICLFTMYGVKAREAGGLPVVSNDVGQFLPKDIVLLAAAFFIFVDPSAGPGL